MYVQESTDGGIEPQHVGSHDVGKIRTSNRSPLSLMVPYKLKTAYCVIFQGHGRLFTAPLFSEFRWGVEISRFLLHQSCIVSIFWFCRSTMKNPVILLSLALLAFSLILSSYQACAKQNRPKPSPSNPTPSKPTPSNPTPSNPTPPHPTTSPQIPTLCPNGRTALSKVNIKPYQGKFNEVSYMAFSKQTYQGHAVVWVGSDGPQTSLHAVNFATGNLIGAYTLAGISTTSSDWESISLGPCGSSILSKTCVYVGNMGNNWAQNCINRTCTLGRDVVEIYKLEEPDINSNNTKSVVVVTLKLNYHHPGFPVNRADSEAMFVDWTGDSAGGYPGDIYVISKSPNNSTFVRIAKIPVSVHEMLLPGQTLPPYSMFPLGRPSGNHSWTGADMSLNGKLMALRTLGSVYFFPRVLGSQTVASALTLPPCSYVSQTQTGAPNQKQFEAVAFMESAGSIYLTEASECDNQAECTVPVHVYLLLFPSLF